MISSIALQFEFFIKSHDGKIIEDYRSEEDGYICAVLPKETHIRNGDIIAMGIALRELNQQLSLHGFVLRLVCSNGAIMHQLQEQVETTEESLADDFETILAQLDEQKLERTAGLFRQSQEIQLQESHLQFALARIRRTLRRETRKNIHSSLGYHTVGRRLRELVEIERSRTLSSPQSREENSWFDLISAITDLAHELNSPTARWELMHLGGVLLEMNSNFTLEAVNENVHPMNLNYS